MATDLLRLSTKATLRAFNDGFTAMKFPVDFKVWGGLRPSGVAWPLDVAKPPALLPCK